MPLVIQPKGIRVMYIVHERDVSASMGQERRHWT